jgi:putative chitinase
MLIKIGSSGDQVKAIQIKLGIDKLPNVPASSLGTFGPITESAVKAFQLKNNLNPDGEVGDETWKVLFPETVINFQVVNGIDLNKLKGSVPDWVLIQLPETMLKFNISTPLRLAHFLAQAAHESGNFTILRENLNYSAKRLKEVFPSYFPGNLADSYGYQPEKIGSRVYANRMGNGNEASKEGYIYSGKGAIQLTGKDNYKAFSTFIGDDCVSSPDKVATLYPLSSAAFYFNSKKLWGVCDKGSDYATIALVTWYVNGGYNGLAERVENFKKFNLLLA